MNIRRYGFTGLALVALVNMTRCLDRLHHATTWRVQTWAYRKLIKRSQVLA